MNTGGCAHHGFGLRQLIEDSIALDVERPEYGLIAEISVQDGVHPEDTVRQGRGRKKGVEYILHVKGVQKSHRLVESHVQRRR